MPNKEQVEFVKIIKRLTNRYHLWQVFSDFCELSAISISNALLMDEKREKQYLDIIGKYNEKEADEFPKLLALVVMGLEDMDCDFLGEIFMHLELSNHWQGQYFTPFHLSVLMAKFNTEGAEAIIQDKGYITLHEPASGAGCMVIAYAKALLDAGINYQHHLHVTAIDVSHTAANMAYIQLSLLHIPAVIHIGDTLTLNLSDTLYTPAHVIDLWGHKIKRQDTRPISTLVAAHTEPDNEDESSDLDDAHMAYMNSGLEWSANHEI